MTSLRCSVEVCLALDGAGVLLAGWLFEPASGAKAVLAAAGAFRDDLTPHLARITRPDVVAALSEDHSAELLERNRDSGFVVVSPGAEPDASGPLTLALSCDGSESLDVPLAPHRFDGTLDEGIRGYLRHALHPVTSVLRDRGLIDRASVRALLACLGAEVQGQAAEETPRQEAAHLSFEASADGVAAAVDHVYFVPGGGVFVVGWLLDAHDKIRRIRTEWSGGSTTSDLVDMVRISRPDVEREYGAWSRERTSDRFGFAFYAQMPGASHGALESSLGFTLMTDAGAYRHLRPSGVQAPPANPLPVIREVLTLAPPGDGRALFKHVGPAVESLWSHRTVLREQPPPVDVGDLPEQVVVSVIVPLYGRYDLIEYQFARFADDPDFRSLPGAPQQPVAELVFVVDDPRIAGDVERLCRDVYPLFLVPCRIIVCSRNHGFAGATNIGAAAARGRLLLLLNSDVLPLEPGWLSRLIALHDALPARGALAPKLLFPDGSIQHVGIEFERLPSHPELWLHTRPSKGFPNHEEKRDGAVAVPAVTTACMLVEKDLYDAVGGLDEGYIIGDVEDTDFCLKLRARGCSSFYAPGVELHHLELQSQTFESSIEWRASLNLYNAWRQTRRWGDEIARLTGSAR